MNKKQKLLAVASAVAVLIAGAAAAGPGKGKHQADPQKQLAKMTESLGLFDDQVPQVEAILTEAAAKRQEIRDTYTISQRREAREAMKAIREATESQLDAVLTDDQKARLAEIKAERRDRRQERRDRRQERRDSQADTDADS